MNSLRFGFGPIFILLFISAVSAIECEQTPDSIEIWKNDSIVCNYLNDVLTCYETMEKQICIEEAVQPCEFKFSYSVTYEKMSVEECFVIHDGKKLGCNPPLEREEVLYEWSGTKTIGVTLPSCQKGDTYKIVLKVEETSPIKGNFEFVYNFGGFDYSENNLFKITVPKGTQLYYTSTKSSEPPVEENDNKVSYTWTAKDTEPLKNEMYMPAMENLIDVVTISSFKDYTKIANWIKNIFEPKIQPQSVKWKADEITSKGGEEAIKEIYDWIRNNIHYVPLEFSALTGYEPHSASEILERGNGDCKDFSVILTSLLRSKGFDAEPVLFSPFNSSLPGIYNFNHVVVRVKLNEKIIWLDPTCEYCPYGSFPYEEYDSYVLPFMSSTEIGKTPHHKEIEYDTYVEIRYQILNDDFTKISSKTFYNDLISAELMRKYNRQMTDIDINKSFEQLAGSICSDYNDLHFSFSNLNKSYEPFVTELEVTCKSLTKSKDNKMIITVLQISSMPPYLSESERNYNFYFGTNSRYKEKIEVTFPEEYTVTSDIRNISVSEYNFAYSVSFEKNGNKAIYITESIDPVEIPKEGYNTMKDFFKSVSKETIEPLEATKIKLTQPKTIHIIYLSIIVILIAAIIVLVFMRRSRKFKSKLSEFFR